MGRYTVHAYDRNHNELWISIGSAHEGATPYVTSDNQADVRTVLRMDKMGCIIDLTTGKPQPHTTLPNGKRSVGKRAIAYFRITDNGTIWKIRMTHAGRKAGIRNYQTRRPEDTYPAPITGGMPITTPRIETTYAGNTVLVIGEGDPEGERLSGEKYIDRDGDDVRTIGTIRRITKAESGSWWGYALEDHVNHNNHFAMPNVTKQDAIKALINLGNEYLVRYGADFTAW